VAQPGLEPGDEIGGYRLGEVLGAGGLGTVHATSGAAGEALAIKIVAHGADASIRSRVSREVEALRRLDHPNVLRLVDAGATDVWSYLVMPRLAGTTLRQLVVNGSLTPESAALLVMFAAHGLGAIHRAGLTHRDLKPDNVMVTDDGRVVIIDLGLALAPDWTRHTTEGAIAGSLPYMAPEQIEGEPAPASDVWALGVTWWELVTGQRPFARGRPAEEVAAIVAGGRPAITDVDRRVGDEAAALIEACLARDAAQRPPDGAALAAAIAPIVAAGLGGVAPATAVIRLRQDRAAWEREVAARIASRCAAKADELATTGDVFAAVRVLDRGLAYRPDDPTLTEALSRIMPGGTPAGAAGSRPRRAPGLAVGTPQRPVAADAIAATDLAHAETAVSGEAPAPAPAPAKPVRRRMALWIAIGVVLAGGGVTAAVLATRGPDARGPTPAARTVYPDTQAGFDRFAQELIDNVREGRRAEFMDLAGTVALPDPATWFGLVFGEDRAARLVEEYEAGPGPRFANIWDELRTVVVHESRSTVTTSRHLDPNDELATGYQVTALRQMQAPIALYRLRLSRADGSNIYALWSWVHIAGRFRLVGKMKQVDPLDPDAEMAKELDLLSELPMVEARRILDEKTE
jgi:hypothetical protein